MRILVTGAAGFIGSNYVLRRLESNDGDTVVSLDKLTYAGNIENLRPVMDDSRHVFVKGDVADARLLDALFTGHKPFDAVINFAAESHVDRSIVEPHAFLATNTTGTFTLLEAARTHGTGVFIQISTDEVYGSLGDDDLAFTESTPLDPSSPYSASKAAGDLLALSYHKTYGMPVIVTRCSNNYGPFQFPEKMIPLFVNNLLKDEPVPIYGDGRNVRDWVHVYDHCSAVDAVLEAGKPGQVYNIGGECEKRNMEVVDALLEIMEKPGSLKKFVADRPGHDFRYAMNIAKIDNEIGWRPSIDFSEGLGRTVQWYRDNTEWLGDVTSGAYRDYYERMYGGR